MGPPSLPAATPCMTESFDQQKLALFEESKAGASFSLHQTSSNLRACSELNGKVSGLTKLQPVLRTLYIYSILTLINLPLYTRRLPQDRWAKVDSMTEGKPTWECLIGQGFTRVYNGGLQPETLADRSLVKHAQPASELRPSLKPIEI
eukprot:1160959-Pelagomonas_calceolata.AAC.4